MGKKGKRRQRAVGGAGSPAGTMKFTAPTSGLEDVYFTWGTAKDAAKFEDTASKLAQHVGTSPWPQFSVASKAMSTLQTPEFEEPSISTREYWSDPTQTVKTNDRPRPGTGGTVMDNPPVLEDWEHDLKVKKYKAKRKIYDEQVLAWKENKTKCYYILCFVPLPEGVGTPTQEFFEVGRDGEQPGCGCSPQDDTGYHPQQEGEEGERDDDRGERRQALHDLPAPRGVSR